MALIVADGVQFGVHAALGPAGQASKSLFYPHAGRCLVGLEIGCVDHHGFPFGVVGPQTDHHLRKVAFIASVLLTVMWRLVRTIPPRRITPPLTTAINEDSPTQYTSIVNVRFAVGFWKIGFKTRHLCAAQRKSVGLEFRMNVDTCRYKQSR